MPGALAVGVCRQVGIAAFALDCAEFFEFRFFHRDLLRFSPNWGFGAEGDVTAGTRRNPSSPPKQIKPAD